LGPRDYELLNKNGIKSLKESVAFFYGYTDMVGRNIEDLAKRVIWEMKSRIDFGWLHIDLDVLSSNEFSAVDYPQSGGLTWEQLEALTNATLSSQRIIGLNLTIYNPDLDKDLNYARRIIRYLDRSIKSLVLRK
jgi:arginase